jgi:receptor expression-enhancing protein 5/6
VYVRLASFLISFVLSSERFKELEAKTGYSKVYFFLVSVVMLSGLILYAGGFKLVTDLVGFLYPAYMSFKSMESSAQKGVDDATQWLTYWVVFSVLTVMEGVAPFIMEWIPMYYVLKVAIIVWLYHPKTTGAEVIYNQVVRPYILPYLEVTKTTKKAE